MLRNAVRLLVPVILVAVIASACGGGYSPEPIPDGGPPLFALLDEIEANGGGILRLQTRHFTRLGLVTPLGDSGKHARLPEHLVNDAWMLFRPDGTGDTAGLDRAEDGAFIRRSSSIDGEYVSEHVPSGTIERRRENTESLAESPDLIAGFRESLERQAEELRSVVADGQMTVEPSGNDGTIVLVRSRAGGCGSGMSDERPAGVVEQRTEVTEADYLPVYITCIVTTPDGREILVNEITLRWERLDADLWDDIVSFVFGG